MNEFDVFTTELKDKVLSELVSFNEMEGPMDIAPWAKEIGLSPKFLKALLEYFVRKGVLKSVSQYGSGYNMYIELGVETFDFVKAGGFAKEEENVLLLAQKLKLEIEALEQDIPKGKFDSVMGLIGLMTTSASYYFNKS